MATNIDEMRNLLADLAAEDAARKTVAKPPLTTASDPASMKAMLRDIEREEAGKPKQSRASQFRGTGVITDPIKVPAPHTVIVPPTFEDTARLPEGGVYGQPSLRAQSFGPPELTRKAAAAGVAFDAAAPVGHALASLAVNEEERVKAYARALSAHFKQPIRVEIGPGTGAVEWLNPQTGRFTLAAPPDQDLMADAAGAAGGSIVMVPELLGGALGAYIFKNPLGASVYGGIGALVGEASRVFLGQKLGINQGITDDQILKAAAKTGTFSAATGIAFDKALAVVKFMRHAFNGDAVSFAKEQADKLGTSIEEAAKIQDQVNAALAAERMRIQKRNEGVPSGFRTEAGPERKFSITLGEASGNDLLLSQQSSLERSRTFAARFGEFDSERERALVDFYEILEQPFNRAVLAPSATATEVKDMAQARFGAGPAALPTSRAEARKLGFEQRRATEHLGRYQADAALALESVETLPLYQLGDIARNVGEAETNAFKGRAEALAASIRTLAGGARFIENTATAKAFTELDAKSRNIFLQALRRETRKEQMIPPKTTVNAQGEAVLNPVFDPTHKRTFAESWDTLSRMKEKIREGQGGDIDLGALKKMAKAIEEDLYNSAGTTELGSLYRNFTHWYRREVGRLNDGTVGKVLAREGGPGGRFTMVDEQVFKNVFPATTARGGSGISPTREFMELIKNDPQAITGFRNAIADDWRRHVMQDATGRVNPARHAEWLAMHQEQLRLKFPGLAQEERSALSTFAVNEPRNAGEALFTVDELRAINSAQGFEKALQAREAKVQQALDGINNTFGAKLANLEDMGQLLQLTKTDLEGTRAKQLVGMLNNPATQDVLRGFRAAYLKDMRERIMPERLPTTQESILRPSALRTWLYGKADGTDKGQIHVIRELFGNKFADGMTTLEKGLSLTARETRFPNRSNTVGGLQPTTVGGHILKGAARAYFGVITTPARVTTSVLQVNRAVSNEIIARALMNPTNMARLMSIWKADIRDRKAIAILGQLGVGPGDLRPQEE